ncbi:MAG: lipid-A-disaccharide synthase [Desulfovibrionaceae bacterium]
MIAESDKPRAESGGAIWINAGEASGDLHGASLARRMLALKPDWRITGMGGPAMEAAGCRLAWSMDAISLVGLTEVLPGLPRIVAMLRSIRRQWKAAPPKAVVLIDCPDFNFRLASMAKSLGIPAYYYISPQVWAWRAGRVKFLEKNVRKVFCILPFEQKFYADHGVAAEFVGHPLLDELPADLPDRPRDPNLVGIFPGSRSKEVNTLAPELAGAARIILDRFPHARFALFNAPNLREEFLLERWDSDIPVEIVPPERRYDGMGRCAIALAASGTVALELALAGVPTAICYKVSALTAFFAKKLVKVRYISLPNLLLDREVFPELILERANAAELGAVGVQWLDGPEATVAIRKDLALMRELLGRPGAAERTARMIAEDVERIGV